ncbi:nucleotide exchange factor GrpE [Hyunsoonleella sp. SJ7]|uniref:Protein GrpE n=1 Tax=Hyunsoonleella aquatilis TaxID=2762758 RepID=A0A923HBQ6_9FLAO|nr:nucleotide exchange factor GrpE [Hyunsoonleella aquatilis]MBC3759574.1 nucleotide exchange factor GrpE [Hyunsoonleella aquatilis]
MAKKSKAKDIEKEQVNGLENEAVAVEEQEQNSSEKEELTAEQKLEAELKREKDKYLRLFAEFENYRKRTSRERVELFATASEDVMKTLLPVLDDFERALTHIEEDKEAEELRKGVLLIYKKLLSTLEQKGLKAIAIEKGDTFDADIHEAVTQIPAPSDGLKGNIIDVIEKGYTLGEKIIRYPKVVIGL